MNIDTLIFEIMLIGLMSLFALIYIGYRVVIGIEKLEKQLKEQTDWLKEPEIEEGDEWKSQ